MKDLMFKLDDMVAHAYKEHLMHWDEMYNSDYESYAVLLEGIQRAENELKEAREYLSKFWESVCDEQERSEKSQHLIKFYPCLIAGASYLLQSAVYTYKAEQTVERGENDIFRC